MQFHLYEHVGGIVKLLVCATEYYPYGSGIANVAYNVVEQLKKRGVECVICSPTGPDLKLGSQRPLGILGLLYYWYHVSTYFKKYNAHEFDEVWLHNPLFIKSCPFNKCLVTMNSTAYGHTDKLYSLPLHIYKKICSKIETFCLNKIKDKSKFTGVGTNICEELKKMGLHEREAIYIPNGVNVEHFRCLGNKKFTRVKFGIPENNIIILSIGRLVQQKNPLKMLEVFSEINKNMNNVTLVVSGSGSLKQKMLDYIQTNNIDNVLFLGYVEEIHKPDLYACCDYFMISSLYEGGEPPLTMSEAMASGLPCIASNITNFRIVAFSNCGFLTDFSDPKRAAKEIQDYISQDNLESSINAREFAVKNLDWNIIAERYLDLFKDYNYE